MINDKALFEFVEPYYVDKDIMHNMWHIELVQRTVNRILSQCSYIVDEECLRLATYFHGFIYRDEARIKQWMLEQNYDEEKVAKTLKIAWESQRSEIPETIEGKILHDAHVLEGGKTYFLLSGLNQFPARPRCLKRPPHLSWFHFLLDRRDCQGLLIPFSCCGRLLMLFDFPRFLHS